jgi:enoyl-CoA hydratase
MTETLLTIERAGGIATFTLNRPDALNALNAALRAELSAAFGDLRDPRDTRVVILTGAGRAFCAGLDLKELGGETQVGAQPNATLSETNMMRALWDCPVPIIGAVNGFAITGGFELALACDFLIASTEARFADTHARVGVVPGWGLSQRLPRLIGVNRAKELSYTGNLLDATRAEAWGLVNRVVEPGALMPTCRALAEDMLSCDTDTTREIKRIIDAGYATTLHEGQALETAASRSWARGVSAEDVAARRRAMQARTRAQR